MAYHQPLTTENLTERLITEALNKKAVLIWAYKTLLHSDDAAETMFSASLEGLKDIRPHGFKPQPDDPNVEMHPITADVSIRIWPSVRDTVQLVCFDFVDSNRHPINTPDGWIVYTVRHDEFFVEPSMEEYAGIKHEDILPGEEKYNTTHDRRIAIRTPDGRTVGIKIPRYNRDGHRVDAEPLYWDVELLNM